MSEHEKKWCGGQSCGCAENSCHGEIKNGAAEKLQTCGGCVGGNPVCDCAGSSCLGQDQGAGCPGKATNGCGGCCPHAAGKEFEWDYDDTVLVFSSDMLEESP